MIYRPKGGKDDPIEFLPRYTEEYTVVDALGILVAEQVRFNTMELVLQKEEKENKRFVTARDLFEYVRKEYLGDYQNWRKYSDGSKKPKEPVKVLVPWLE